MDVEAEGNRGSTELADTVRGVKPAGQADLDDSLAERSSVGDDVDVASSLTLPKG